jgi:hypothetical protein
MGRPKPTQMRDYAKFMQQSFLFSILCSHISHPKGRERVVA